MDFVIYKEYLDISQGSRFQRDYKKTKLWKNNGDQFEKNILVYKIYIKKHSILFYEKKV